METDSRYTSRSPPMTSRIPIHSECEGLPGEYNLSLSAVGEVFNAGDEVTVWVNGVGRTLVVPPPGQETEPATQVAGPHVAENRPPRPTEIPVDPATILPTQDRYGVTPDGRVLLTAPVEKVSMALSGGTGKAPTLTLVTAIPNSCQEFGKYEVIGFNPGLSVNVTYGVQAAEERRLRWLLRHRRDAYRARGTRPGP